MPPPPFLRRRPRGFLYPPRITDYANVVLSAIILNINNTFKRDIEGRWGVWMLNIGLLFGHKAKIHDCATDRCHLYVMTAEQVCEPCSTFSDGFADRRR